MASDGRRGAEEGDEAGCEYVGVGGIGCTADQQRIRRNHAEGIELKGRAETRCSQIDVQCVAVE